MEKINALTFEAFYKEYFKGSSLRCSFLGFVDGRATGHTLKVSELEASLRMEGVFDIFGCTCLCDECDDYDILVRHKGNAIIWEAVQHTIGRHVTRKIPVERWSEEFREMIVVDAIHLPFVFLKKDMQRVVGEMRAFLHKHGEDEGYDEDLERLLRYQKENGRECIQQFLKSDEKKDEWIRKGGPLGPYEEKEFEARVCKAGSWFDFFHLIRSSTYIHEAEGKRIYAGVLIQQLQDVRERLADIGTIPECYGFREKARELLQLRSNERLCFLDTLRFHYEEEAFTEREFMMRIVLWSLNFRRGSEGLTFEEIASRIKRAKKRKKRIYRTEVSEHELFSRQDIAEAFRLLEQEGAIEKKGQRWFVK